MSIPTALPSTRQVGAERPMQASGFVVRRPALERYRTHVLYGGCSGDPRTCQRCFDLIRDASAESWQRAARGRR